MPNQHKNKVIFGNTVLIDISDTTATAADVISGKYFYDKTGAKVEGTASSGTGMTVVETTDSHGGTIVTITGEEIKMQSKTGIAPTESSQTITPDNGYNGLQSVQINGISSTYVGSGVNRKAAATITPTKSQQTIQSGTYLTGTQTIAAIPAAYQDVTGVTATAGDVVSGKTIVDSTGAAVNGSLVIQHYYTGNSAPSSSLGINGDIYLQIGG